MANTKTRHSGFQADADVHVAFEDQQKINRFVRLNAKLVDYNEELKTKQNELKNLEDACDELTLMDDDIKIPYQIGEVFVHQDLEKTQNCLEDAKNKKRKEIEVLNSLSTPLKATISELKTQLYGKFGTHINLESEDES